MDIRRLMLGLFLTVMVLNTILSVSKLGMISSLPADIVLGWGVATVLGLVLILQIFSNVGEPKKGKGDDMFGDTNF